MKKKMSYKKDSLKSKTLIFFQKICQASVFLVRQSVGYVFVLANEKVCGTLYLSVLFYFIFFFVFHA